MPSNLAWLLQQPAAMAPLMRGELVCDALNLRSTVAVGFKGKIHAGADHHRTGCRSRGAARSKPCATTNRSACFRSPCGPRATSALYRPADVDRLLFIRHARDLGFSLEAIRDLLSLADQPDQACEAVDAIARTQLVEVERRIERLVSLKAELERMIQQCSGGKISDCRVIQALSDQG